MRSRRPKQDNNGYSPPVSPPQLFLFGRIKSIYPDARLNYPIKTDRGYRYADIALIINGLDRKKLRLDIEYDGQLAHKHRKKKDQERDFELLRAGWKTIRVNKFNLQQVFSIIEEEIKNHVAN